jgi:hypothetical protein
MAGVAERIRERSRCQQSAIVRDRSCNESHTVLLHSASTSLPFVARPPPGTISSPTRRKGSARFADQGAGACRAERDASTRQVCCMSTRVAIKAGAR